MATLPTLRPNGAGDYQANLVLVGSTAGWENIDDDPDAHDGDTTYVENSSYATGELSTQVTDTPADFQSMDSLTVTVALKRHALVDDTAPGLSAQIFKDPAGTVALADIAAVVASGWTTNDAGFVLVTVSLPLTVDGSAATKAEWDAAHLDLFWSGGSAAMGNDNAKVRVTAVELNGTYVKTAYVFADAQFPSGTARVGPFSA